MHAFLRLARHLLTRWFLASVLFGGGLAVAINACILWASSKGTSVGTLVNDGSIIAAAMIIEAEWLLVAWYSLHGDEKRRAVFVANLTVFGLLVSAYVGVRVDELVADEKLFSASAVRATTAYGTMLTLIATACTALIVGGTSERTAGGRP